MNSGYFARVLPLIESASEAARDRAKRVIFNGHILWQVYLQERSRLMSEAARVKDGEPLEESGERMSADDFEAYLIRLTGESESTVWAWDAEESEDEKEKSDPTDS